MWILRDITDPEFQKVCGMNSFHGTMNSFHGGMNSGTRWNEFIPGGMNSFYSRVSYTENCLISNGKTLIVVINLKLGHAIYWTLFWNQKYFGWFVDKFFGYKCYQ